ncbi:serine acetyltransferase [Klebsiella pneumoniae]|uniref:Serine acetyltransferase n=1 Tax=Klebsiella pneumoniae TaxID=573 RepID=A0A378FSU8_KLEPN|nr:serine acetyltransferase [Klebsiella pneumoniae]
MPCRAYRNRATGCGLRGDARWRFSCKIRSPSLSQVDIHPAAKIGRGIMLDHATGIVVGETAVIEDDVSILQSVTLGGTGKTSGDRHPKIREGRNDWRRGEDPRQY